MQRFPRRAIGATADLEVAPGVSPIEDVRAALRVQDERLTAIQKTTAEELRWRKVGTWISGIAAAIALVRLSEIWIALKRRPPAQ